MSESDSIPFFVVGCGRSGTTLLRTMLNRHPDVAIPLESLWIVDYLQASPRDMSGLVPTMLNEFELSEWQIAVAPGDLAGAATPKEAVERLHEIYAGARGKRIWGQKTPRFVRYGNLLKSNWPRARFIHVIRDPRAVVSSMIRSNAHRSNAYFGARRWCRDVEAGLALREMYPNDVLEVRYEELVSDPDAMSKQVCDFLGLRHEPCMLEEPEDISVEYGRYYSKVHKLLGAKPDAGRIDAWRDDLNDRQLRLVEHICAPLMERLGYQRLADGLAPSWVYRSALRLERLRGVTKLLAKYRRERPGYMWCYVKRKLRVLGPRRFFLESFS